MTHRSICLPDFPAVSQDPAILSAGLIILSFEISPSLVNGPHPHYTGGFQRSKLQLLQHAKGPQNRQQAIGD